MGAGRARTRRIGLLLAAGVVLFPLASAPVGAIAGHVAPVRPSAPQPRSSPALRGRIPDVDTDHLLVRFASRPADLSQRLAGAGASIARQVPGTRWTVLSTPHGSARAVRARLRSDRTISQVEYSYRRHALSLPNDPKWSTAQQSYLAPIRVDRASDVSTGSGVTVAVVDTGVDLDHPDLANRLVAGRDIANNDATPQDDVGHGTMVAGVIAADRNNHRGIAGIAPLATIMPVKVLGRDGSGDDTDIAAGIDWARTHGAAVINLSLGGPATDVVLQQSVADAIAAGIVVVAAAGNDGAETVGYPASYPGVIAVSATTHGGALAAFSSYGARVDLAAPGLDITSTALGSSEAYGVESGTSFSSPIVAGIAALVRARNPGFSGAQTRARLLDTARDVGPPGVDRAFGHGLVDALAAVDLTHPAAPRPAARLGSNEPNDVPSDATTLAIGATANSAISPETDEDWYAVHFAGTGWYNIAVSHGSGALDHDMQPIVELYDSNHALEASQDLLGGDLLVPIDAVGDGFVRVRNRGGDTASYTIHIKTASAPSQFGDPIELFLGTLASSVAIGDLNNDGRNDIAFLLGDASASPDTLVTLRQTSNRSFTLGEVIATDVTVGRALSIGDLDGNNENDVALAVAGGVDIYTQSGGALDPTATFVATGTTPAQIAVARVDGDPDNDIVVGGPDGIHVYYGPGFGASDAVETTTAITNSLAVGDVNGNASADIVAVASGTLLVYTQDGAHSFIATSHAVTSARSVATGDVDHDGGVDAVATLRSSVGHAQTLLHGDTLGALATTESRPDAIAIADVDQDGRNDVVVLHDDSGDVGVLTQQNDGSLGVEHLFFFDDFNPSYGATALAAGDIDSDTYPDIVVATSWGVSILIQNAPHLPTLGNTWVADASPAALATNVASGVTPVLTLDRVATNVDGTTVQLLDAAGEEVSQTPVWDGGGRTITITPDAPLPDGAYTVRVDGLSDGSADKLHDYFLAFTVGAAPDETAPVTALVSPPTGYRVISAATIEFTSNDGAAVFECSLDNAKYHWCTSPVRVDVAKGPHSFRVFARDAAGNEDATPALATWTFRPPSKGYWMVGRTGVVYHFGTVPGLGNAATKVATDIEASRSGFGYWVVDASGRVLAFGDAVGRGNASGLPAGETVTSLSRTASGNGYWLFTSRGRVLAFGDAHSYGDLRHRALNGPIRDSVRTPSGHGYFMVAADGGVFAFGDAVYKGSTGGRHIPAPIRTLVADPDRTGYWLAGTDGSVYAFAAANRGSMHGVHLNRPIAGMVGFGNGYLMVGSDGGIFNFSNQQYFGSLGGNPPASPIVSVAVAG